MDDGVPAVELVGIDRVLRTFYAALSGAPRERRWHQLRALFEAGSRVRTGDGTELHVDEYIRQAREEESPRTLVEVDRAVRVDRDLAFVASAYRAFSDGDAAVLGVNEFVLRKVEARWRIAGAAADPGRAPHGGVEAR
jgi:hypothetical protein